MPKKLDAEEREITIAILKETVAVVLLHAFMANSANDEPTETDIIYLRGVAQKFVSSSPLLNLL